MLRLYAKIRPRFRRRYLRVLALSVPTLTLVVVLPLLRPLRHPDPRDVTDDELARLGTIHAIVERHSEAIDTTLFPIEQHTIHVDRGVYADQPPALAGVLAVPYWAMRKFGVTFEHNFSLVSYLLTVIGGAIPTAAVAGIIYKSSKVFDLSRPKRVALAFASVFGTGLLAYATVLNPHVPAAALLVAAAGCLIHLIAGSDKLTAGVWLAGAGCCASLAAAIDLPAAVFLPLFTVVVLSIGWPWPTRAGGVVMFVLGMLPVWVLHAGLTVPVTGNLAPGVFHPELRPAPLTLVRTMPRHAPPMPVIAATSPESTAAIDWYNDDDTADAAPAGLWANTARAFGKLATSLFLGHGVLVHFPLLVVACFGVFGVMHRHWPAAIKVLAASTLIGSSAIVIYTIARNPDWRDAAFAVKWFITFSPLLTLWAGAWLRRPHRPQSWAMAGVAAALSVTVTIVGTLAGPLPPQPYSGYTAAAAARRLVHPVAETNAGLGPAVARQ